MRQTIGVDTKNVPSSTNVSRNMGQSHKKTSNSADENQRRSKSPNKSFDVRQWTSTEVQRWIKHQCKKFELKNTDVNKFEMNGQALVLLTKNDFLRRSADGELLYYALQRLINSNKVNKIHQDQSSSSTKKHPRIVELNGDQDSSKGLERNTTVPIIEEPDDPPKIIRSQSADAQNQDEFDEARQRAYFAQQRRFQRPFFPMAHPFYQHGLHANGFAHGHPHQFQHQHYPMAFGQGVLIELVDETTTHPSMNNNAYHQQTNQQLYMVTMNGQRVVMDEQQVIKLVNDLYQRQNQENQAAFVFYQ